MSHVPGETHLALLGCLLLGRLLSSFLLSHSENLLSFNSMYEYAK